ncbi:MAG TPA: M23 family metallopeptidase [Dongiaceae bacterium]|nr:M23 family metallopeptidase [Dongiaceae bacterium]
MVRTSRLGIAAAALQRLVGEDAVITPAGELCGFENLIPLRARSGGDERLYVGIVTSAASVGFDRASDGSRLAGGPQLASKALAVFEQLIDVTPQPFSWYDTGAPRRARWIEDEFYEISGPEATALVYAQWQADGTIRRFVAGYGFGQPEARFAGAALDFEAVPLDVPFRVVWGGRSFAENHHYYHRRQRYAIDLEPDPPAAAAGVVAPVAGIVVDALDGVEDNPVYAPAPSGVSPFGNHVTIRAGDKDVMVCHLQRGSVAVTKSQHVVAGTPLGLVGNSGSSSIPHLHCHVETVAPVPHGIPVRFPFAGAHREPIRGAQWTAPSRILEHI